VVFGLAVGLPITFFYERAGREFVSILDAGELPWSIFASLVGAPTLWTFYIWQPSGIIEMFRELSQNGVLVQKQRGISIDAFLQEQVRSPCNRVRNFATALVVTVISFLLWLPMGLPSGLESRYGVAHTWASINPVYYWLIWVPIVFVGPYMFAWLVIRQAITLRSLARVFDSFELRPKPFHPDRCNGLSSIGDYALRLASIAILFGLWVAVMVTGPVLAGRPITFDHITVLILMSYFVVVPVLLIPSVWSAHLAMSRAKAEALEAVAVQMRKVLSQTGTHMIATSGLQAEQLEKKYRLLDREHRNWPFRLPTLARFSLAAALPLFSTVASILLDAYFK